MNANAAQSGVLLKLMAFSIALGVLPLSSYYGSLHYLWEGNTIYSAITAVVAANVVLVSYIITATLEEGKASKAGSPSETRKER